MKRPTWSQLRDMYRDKPTQLWWARRDTRWDVYPGREPLVLVAHNWEGTWLPLQDGTWFKSPVSYIFVMAAHTPDLRGEWIEHKVTPRASLWDFHRAEPALSAGGAQ